MSTFEVHALHYTVIVMMQELQKLLLAAGHLSEEKIKSFNSFTAKVEKIKDISETIKDITLKIQPANWQNNCHINLRLQTHGAIWSAIEGNLYYPSETKGYVSFSCETANTISPKLGDKNMNFFKPKKQ